MGNVELFDGACSQSGPNPRLYKRQAAYFIKPMSEKRSLSQCQIEGETFTNEALWHLICEVIAGRKLKSWRSE